MRYIVYVRYNATGMKLFKFEELKTAADYVADFVDQQWAIWDSVAKRWLSGAEILLAAVMPDNSVNWEEEGF